MFEVKRLVKEDSTLMVAHTKETSSTESSTVMEGTILLTQERFTTDNLQIIS